MEKLVCINHIDDYAIKRYIRSHSYLGQCDYCNDNRYRRVISLDDLGEFMTRAIRCHYHEAVDELRYDSAEGGYLGDTFENDELLYSEIGLDIDNSMLESDLCGVLPDTVWCYKNPYELTKSQEMEYDWNYFKYVVKHRARYSFFYIEEIKEDWYGSYPYNISKILADITMLIKKYKLIKTLEIGTVFYRCRQHESAGEITEAKEIAAPPYQSVTFSNRMSPAGISMFYAGFDAETAIMETVDVNDDKKPYYTIGQFSTKNEIMVVDFSTLPSQPSIFDVTKLNHYHPIDFLKSFVTDLSKSVIKDGREHIEYVPTQVVTEYIRYILFKNQKHKVGGIVYPSSKKRGSNACVLFLDNKESLRELTFDNFVIQNKRI